MVIKLKLYIIYIAKFIFITFIYIVTIYIFKYLISGMFPLFLQWNKTFFLSGRTGKEIPASRTNTGLLFPSFVVRLLRSLVQFSFNNGGTGYLQFT